MDSTKTRAVERKEKRIAKLREMLRIQRQAHDAEMQRVEAKYQVELENLDTVVAMRGETIETLSRERDRLVDSVNSKSAQIRSLKTKLCSIGAVLRTQNIDRMSEKIEELHIDMARMLSWVQCPNSPCSCKRSELARRVAEEHLSGLVLYFNNKEGPMGEILRNCAGDDERGCDDGSLGKDDGGAVDSAGERE